MRVPVKTNDERSQTQLWRAFRAELLRFILKRVRDNTLAEDIVHDVFIKAFSHRDELQDADRLRPWLYQITRNALVDRYRSQKPLDPLPEDLIGHAEEDRRAEQDLALCLRPLLRELPEQFREALMRTALKEDITQQQFALREGLSVSGAKSRIQRARKMLREALLQCCRVEMNQKGDVLGYEPVKGCECHEDSPELPNKGMQPTARTKLRG
jgi:RNA polymerase sigma-70 factor, ECF subfamily